MRYRERILPKPNQENKLIHCLLNSSRILIEVDCFLISFFCLLISLIVSPFVDMKRLYIPIEWLDRAKPMEALASKLNIAYSKECLEGRCFSLKLALDML